MTTSFEAKYGPMLAFRCQEGVTLDPKSSLSPAAAIVAVRKLKLMVFLDKAQRSEYVRRGFNHDEINAVIGRPPSKEFCDNLEILEARLKSLVSPDEAEVQEYMRQRDSQNDVLVA